MSRFSEKDVENEISSIKNNYGEYMEMMTEGQKAAFILNNITLKLLVEREMKDFYKKITHARYSVGVNT